MDSPDPASVRARSRPRQAGSSVPVSPLAPVAHALLLGGATASVFLAGGAQQGALGIFLLCAGVAMTACPPRVKVEWRLWAAAAALVVCASLALLPEHALPQPAWRQTLDATPPIAMPGTISTDPALTGFWLAVLAFTLLAGLFMLTQPIRSRWLLVFALAAALAAGTYGALAIYARNTGWRYPFAADATFGFFPNRNHTATLLFVGSLLALGVLGVVLREGRWLAGLLAAGVLTVCAAGLGAYSPTRAGIVFLLAGTVLWLAGLGRAHRDRRLVVSFVALGLASGLLFLLSGGEVRDRLFGRVSPAPIPVASALRDAAPAVGGVETGDSMHNLSNDFRFRIYRDTLDVIRDFPLTGLGLGTFALDFPQYRRASLSESPAIHPESDFLMLTAEAGIPAVLCLVALVVMAAGRLFPERQHPYWPLRWGCAVAAAAAALHGMVDVPIHRVPLGWWVLVVAGLALQSSRTGTGVRSQVQRAIFVGGGVLAVLSGVMLLRAQWFGGTPLPPFAYLAEQAEFFRLIQPQPDRAIWLARQTVKAHPMEESAYLNLGQALFLYDDTDTQVDAAFRAERLLNPNRTAIAVWQGDTWIAHDPARTVALWQDALARCTRNIRVTGHPVQEGTPEYFFSQLLNRAAAHPEVQKRLWDLVGQDAALAFAWVETVTPSLAPDGIGRLGTDERFLRGLDAAGQRRFLGDWYRRGDHAALTAFLDGHGDWQAVAWSVRLRLMAEAGQFERAVAEAARHYGISLALPEQDAGSVGSPDAAQETANPAGAFLTYWKQGNVASARRVLDEATNRPETAALSALWRLQAAMAARNADWPAAWRSLEREIAIEHPDEAL